MTIKELMVKIEKEIEAARQSGAWEFDYHAAMEEVDALLNNEMSRLASGDDVKAEPVEEVAESEIKVEPEDMEAFKRLFDPDAVEGVPLESLSEKERGLLTSLMKGVRKATADISNLMYREIIRLKPTDFKFWRSIRKKYFPDLEDTRYVILKFKKAGAVEWNGDLKSEVVWL